MHIGDRSDIFYASWHQYPFYPRSGAATQTNRHQTIVNCPLHIGACETELLASWQTRVRPALEEFEPQLILISAGFDADTRDPLASLQVTTNGFRELSQQIVEWSDRHCGGRLVSVLEGGYHLDALAEDVAAHVATLL